jgi:hypothetical protein
MKNKDAMMANIILCSDLRKALTLLGIVSGMVFGITYVMWVMK